MMIKLKPVEIRRLYKQHKNKFEIVLVLDNIQFAQNTAALFRIADSFNVREIICCGITTKPPFGKSLQKVSREKEKKLKWSKSESLENTLRDLRKQGFLIITTTPCEPSTEVSNYHKHKSQPKVAIILSNEVHGTSPKAFELIDDSVYAAVYDKYASHNITIEAALILEGLISQGD